MEQPGEIRSMKRMSVIGVTPGFAEPSVERNFCRTADIVYLDTNYLKRIEEAGGLPILLSHTAHDNALEQLGQWLDGLLLSGGSDVHPERYGQDLEFEDCSLPGPRDEYELRLVASFIQTRKPILAICRGIQVLNVALGGTLVQDIPRQFGSGHHVQIQPSVSATHAVRLDDSSRLAGILGDTVVGVNSHHHQAIDSVGAGLRVVGRSEEGVIEAVEHTSHPYMIGVQWHPERLAMGVPSQQNIFSDFVSACGGSRGR
jgi:putative glutamine amidotransferase